MLLKNLSRFYSHFSIHSIFNFLLPPICVICGYHTQNSRNICTRCQFDLPILPQNCFQCGQFLPENINASLLCGSCLNQSPPFDFTYALFPYEWPITSLIVKLKFQHQLCYAQALGELLTQKIQTTWYANRPLPDLILPVPLHAERLKQRGFNQALEIAKPISKALKIKIDTSGVKRIKATVAQSGLSATKRKRNIANAFAVYHDYSGLNIAIVDDVITTGSTIMECCKELKKHGAKNIDVWCCARRG